MSIHYGERDNPCQCIGYEKGKVVDKSRSFSMSQKGTQHKNQSIETDAEARRGAGVGNRPTHVTATVLTVRWRLGESKNKRNFQEISNWCHAGKFTKKAVIAPTCRLHEANEHEHLKYYDHAS